MHIKRMMHLSLISPCPSFPPFSVISPFSMGIHLVAWEPVDCLQYGLVLVFLAFLTCCLVPLCIRFFHINGHWIILALSGQVTHGQAR